MLISQKIIPLKGFLVCKNFDIDSRQTKCVKK